MKMAVSKADVATALPVREKLACITLDFELDYGGRVGRFGIYEDDSGQLRELGELYRSLSIPVSAFVQTSLLEDYPGSLECVQSLADDFHSHSHTHNMQVFDSREEIAACTETFERFFGHRPLGYRGPQGMLYDGDTDLLVEHGYKFSASVFPTYRPGRFDNRGSPLTPFRYGNGLVEMPFGAIPAVRFVVSLSHLKLLGWTGNRLLMGLFGLPPVLVVDTHLHDYIINEQSFAKLPTKYRWAYSRNKRKGKPYLTAFVAFLRRKGYRFVTMTEIHESLEAAGGGA